MEALYGYMTESEKYSYIMEKEFDIKMKRLFLKSSYISEAGDSSKKQSVFQKMIKTIKEFVQKIIKSMSEFMAKIKEKKIGDKIKKAPPVKMDYDPKKEFNILEKEQNSLLNKLKHPGLIKKDETGTHLTSKGKKVAVGAGVTVSAAVIFDIYRRINKMMKDLYSQELAIDSHSLEFDRIDDETKAQDEKNKYYDATMSNLQKNISEANNLRKDLEERMRKIGNNLEKTQKVANKAVNDVADLRMDVSRSTRYDIMTTVKKRYPNLNKEDEQKINNILRDQINDSGQYSKSFILKKISDYMKDKQ